MQCLAPGWDLVFIPLMMFDLPVEVAAVTDAAWMMEGGAVGVTPHIPLKA